MNIIQVIVLAIIEGITEFLPVSSTGHMVITSSLMGIETDPFVKLFEIVIQLGAILAVVVLYFKRFVRSVDFYVKLVVGVIPAVILGVLFKKKIDILLESPLIVAVAFVLGGIILLFVDDWFNHPTVDDEREINHITAFKIGVYQCLAMVPGFALGRIHCWRYEPKTKPQGRCGIFVLFGGAYHVWCHRKRSVGFS
jgi:undecaprenyl-diphosphatase